jgi:Bacterial Ig-like domain (group 2)/Beta xylosidase C-terminal Concanavalin A-like domain
MRKLIFSVLFALSWRAHATVYEVIPSQNTSTIQSIINNAAVGSTVAFAQGTYQLTSGLTLKCGVAYTAAVQTVPSNVVLSASTLADSQNIFTINGGCTSPTVVSYLSSLHAGFLFVSTPNSNLTVTQNQVGDLPCCNNNAVDSGFFASDPAGSNVNALTNATIIWNQFGDATSCTGPNFDAFTYQTDDEGPDGNCSGMTIATSTNGVIFENNVVTHVGEGVHITCYGTRCDNTATPPGPVTIGLVAKYNDFSQIHRIAWEEQAEIISDVDIEYNVLRDWLNPYFGSFGFSMACCANSASYAPFLDESNNVVLFNTVPTPSYGVYGYGFEAWGDHATYAHNLVETSNYTWNITGQGAGPGIAWGYGTSSASYFVSNTVCGPVFASQGYIVTEGFDGVQSPALSGNVTTPTCPALTSAAPTISPATGLQTYPLKVTLSDPGYTSGPQPLGNTGIWYTTDGSNPVPGSGTAKYLANGGTFVLPAPATVKAVGMWGARNQPASYPSGYGFVPSPVISAVFKVGSGSTLASAYLVPNSRVSSIPVGKTLQFIAHGVYSDGTSSVLPDSKGNAVTAWNTSNHAVAKISSLGHVTAMSAGTATIEAFIGNLEASTSAVTVTPAIGSAGLVSAYLVPNGGVKSIPVGKTLQFIAHGVYSDGTSALLPDSAGNEVTAWNTSNHAVAKISSLGHVTAMSAGTATIEAFIGHLEASTSAVTVIPIVASKVQPAVIESPLAPRLESALGSVRAVPSSPIGDKFLGPLWKAVTPNGGSASITDGHLVISVPGGSNHDTLGPSNDAARVVQPIGDTDFDVSIKIDSKVEASDAGTSQGIMVMSDDDAFITFALTTDGTNIGLVARTVNAGVSTTVLEDTNFNQYQNPMYLRLARSGVAYVASYSTDGLHWTQATSFTYIGTLALIGPFVSNYNSSPESAVPVAVSVDWFNVE